MLQYSTIQLNEYLFQIKKRAEIRLTVASFFGSTKFIWLENNLIDGSAILRQQSGLTGSQVSSLNQQRLVDSIIKVKKLKNN